MTCVYPRTGRAKRHTTLYIMAGAKAMMAPGMVVAELRSAPPVVGESAHKKQAAKCAGLGEAPPKCAGLGEGPPKCAGLGEGPPKCAGLGEAPPKPRG